MPSIYKSLPLSPSTEKKIVLNIKLCLLKFLFVYFSVNILVDSWNCSKSRTFREPVIEQIPSSQQCLLFSSFLVIKILMAHSHPERT